MTAVRLVQITCDCDCTHLSTHGCLHSHPDHPAELGATEVRELAAARGWEVMRARRHGRDICPPCRIKAIQSAAGAHGAAEPEEAGDG